MSAGEKIPSDPPPWLALLGPLPSEAAPRASPVAPALHAADGGPFAGWESLVLELSAGPSGLRILQVLLDAEGRLLSGSDHVLLRSEPAGQPSTVQIRQESIGGRFESDGEFRGTFWLITGPEPVDDEEPRWEMSPRKPTQGEVEALRQLVAEVVRRQAKP